MLRFCLLLAALTQVSACVVSPRVELGPKIDFSAMQPDQKPLSYADLMCCSDCRA